MTIPKWLLPAERRAAIWAYFQTVLESRPRKYLLVVMFIVTFGALEGFREFPARIIRTVEVLQEVSKDIKLSTSGKFDISIEALLKIAAVFFPIAWRLLAAVIIAAAVPASVEGIANDVIRVPKTKGDIESLAAMLEDGAGIVNIYPAATKVNVTVQPYAKPILEALADSPSIRILSIAGFEYLGKGSESLLFETIRKRPNLRVEVIVLDPEKGAGVIKDRVACLQQNRENTLTESEIKRQIGEMALILRVIKDSSHTGDIELRYYSRNPGFRIILMETCLFFSCYDSNVHGHESPVFKVEKKRDRVALYEAFEQTYQNIRSSCKGRATTFL